jgi:outer membrane protein OmpA-like peptidoglycan-associated protein
MYRVFNSFAPLCSRAAALATLSLLAACATEPERPAIVAPVAAPVAAEPSVKLPIVQSARGVEVTLPDSVLFDSGKAELKEALAAPYLDRLAELLKRGADKLLLVEGHTDSQGALSINQKLSEQRAGAVADALVRRGVAVARMERKGFAASRPVAPNDVEAGRRLNRRSEIIILGETIENFTRGEPANSFEDAAARVKAALEAGGKK